MDAQHQGEVALALIKEYIREHGISPELLKHGEQLARKGGISTDDIREFGRDILPPLFSELIAPLRKSTILHPIR